MLRAIQDFFRSQMGVSADGVHDEHSLRLAAAALLFEMLRADDEEHPHERRMLEQELQRTFSLNPEETGQLAALAEREAQESVSLYQFTSLINKNFSIQEKIRLVEMLWQVAYADQHLDRYEEALVRKVSELIHVPHRDFMQAKHRVLDALRK